MQLNSTLKATCRRRTSSEEETIAAYRESVRDLYQRLRRLGIDAGFVRSFVLPEWWQDELADVGANRALAEAYIAKQLGFSVDELRDAGRELRLPSLSAVRFKRYRNEVDDRVRVSALVAQRAAAALVRSAGGVLPPFEGPQSARQVREAILRRSRYVDLETLLDFCWGAGIPVLHLAHRPAGSKPFDGMAGFVDDRPLIVLATGRDSPPWLAFYVAHELGHIMVGHVRPGTQAWVDGTLTSTSGSSPEREADRFACEVLTGFESPQIKDLRAGALQLAVVASRSGPPRGIDPGVYALIYAKSNNRWPAAQAALRHMGLDAGGQRQVAARLRSHLRDADLSESEERILSVLEAA